MVMMVVVVGQKNWDLVVVVVVVVRF